MEFTNAEIRAILKFFFVQGETAKESHRRINNVLGDGTVSLRTAEEWFRRFRIGRNDTTDRVSSGRPVSSDVDKMIERIQQDPHVTVSNLARQLQLGYGTIYRHLKAAGYTKKLGVWVSHV